MIALTIKNSSKTFEWQYIARDNKITWIEIILTSIVLDGKKVIHFVFKNIDEKKSLEEELKLLASTDPMTKLYNRRYFYKISESIVDLAARENTNTSIVMIDIDKFKNVNDTYGHKIGDIVIINIASIIQTISRKSDIVSRWGGEEFLILLPNTDIEGALIISQKIRTQVENSSLNISNGEKLISTISIGISQINTKNDKDVEDAINRADTALYEAKENGRNKVCVKYDD